MCVVESMDYGCWCTCAPSTINNETVEKSEKFLYQTRRNILYYTGDETFKKKFTVNK